MTDERDRDDAADGTFDQTNGLAEGLEGESDGTAVGEERSDAERGDDDIFDEVVSDFVHGDDQKDRDPNP